VGRDLGHAGLEVHNGLQVWGLLFHLAQQRLPEVVEVKDKMPSWPTFEKVVGSGRRERAA
jgi:hypothetical protein